MPRAWFDHRCIDKNHVWAQGDSNGGMFTFDLAVDSRTAHRFAGIGPGIGLPHYGYNQGLAVTGAGAGRMSLIGVWGKQDTTVPPVPVPHDGSGGHPERTMDTDYSGWYYQSYTSTLAKWAEDNGCDAASAAAVPATEAWGIDAASDLECTRYSGCPVGVDVVGCLHSGGHNTGAEGRAVMLEFMSQHRKADANACTGSACSAKRGLRRIWG